MFFKKIEMHGFKSFADSVNVEFHRGITCVVGPNGSGKSNISDALRWVLGEQSPKTLRGGKMEEVIFAGTVSRKSKGMAEVTLVIDNSDKSLAVDYAEVAITRKMYRSGESEYFINNVQCRLKDIRELIMDTGIAVDGYSIIGQGKISEIVSNKAESRREIFEEAAGIIKYRSKKAESERKLENANRNLERVNDIIGEIAQRIDKLKEESVSAKEYLELRDRLKSIEINITLKNIENIELKNEYLKDDILETAGAIEENQESRKSIDSDIAENRQRNEELETLEREIGARLLTASNELGHLKSVGDVNEEKIAGIEKDCARISDEIESAEAKLSEEQGSLNDLKNKEAELQIKIDKEQEILSKQTEEARLYNYRVDEFAKAAEDRKSRVYELYNTISVKKTEIQSYENIINTLGRRKSQVAAELEEAGRSEESKRAEFEVYISNAEKAESALNQLEEEIRQLSDKYSQSSKAEREKTQALQKLRLEKGEVSARKKAIEELEAAYEGYNHAVRFIMSRTGSLSGIHGVVADLIDVPRGYETAIETALGQALQNIVCDGDSDAKRAIQMLKENRAGRLTFLPINNIRPNGFRNLEQAFGVGAGGNVSKEDMQGVKGIASQCVRYDKKYSGIIEYLLGRVILVDHLDNALRLSKKTHGGARFITLEGDVINPSGAITGGAHRQTAGNLLERKAEARTLEDKLIELASVEVELTGNIENLHQEIAVQEEQIAEQRQKHRDAEIELTNVKNQRDQMELEIAGLLDSMDKWKHELSNIRREEDITYESTNRLKGEINEASDEVTGIEAQTDTGLKEYEEAKETIELYNKRITESKLMINSLTSEKNNLDVLASRITGFAQELAGQNAQREQMLIALQTQRSELLESVSQHQADTQEKQEIIAELEEQLKEYQEEKRLIVRYLKEVEEKRAELDATILNFQTQAHELELKLAKNQSQVDSYKDRLWEEFEISYIYAMEFKNKNFVMNAAVKEAREIKDRIKELGEVNVGAISEYETTSERYTFLTEQKEDMVRAIKALREIIEDMDRTIRQKFKESFDQIAECFTLVFRELFGGGNAELKLENAENLMESSVEIVAQPPGKRLQNINLMSGGEKTLTAIALMASVLKVKPTPFVILDEVEAALDETNIVRFAKYIKSFQGIQFVLVTHQKLTMEFADVLYGVTMPEQGISKVISLKLGDSMIDEL